MTNRRVQLTRRLSLGEEQLFLLLAILIGVYSGFAVVLFRLTIQFVQVAVFGTSLTPAAARVVLAPAAAGLLVAVVVERWFPTVRGSGVNQTKAALYVYDGYISFRTVIGKFLTSAVAIGSGHSLGPEDPSLQIGAGLASALGRRLALSRERLRYIAPVGAAAGLAAAFNSPITAVLFVIEEVIGRWTAGVLGAVVLAAVSSVVTEQWFLGDQPLFHVPAYHLVHAAELLAYAAIGLIGGGVSLAFVKTVAALRPRFRSLPSWTWYLQPAIAGLLVGAIGTRFPHVMGAGYTYIDQAMHDQYTWRVLAAVCALKVVTTAASFTSGTPGGLFAPTLFIGAMLGATICAVERLIAPGATGPMGAYALVGMGALFAGILRAPMTSVFMIVEVSGNYTIILPVMIANTIAYVISRRFQPQPLFDVLSRQDGIELPSMEEEREVEVRSVADAMRPGAAVRVDADTSPAAALAKMSESGTATLLVLLQSGEWGALTREQLESAGDAATVADLAAPLPRPYLYPDQSVETALRALHGQPVVPVVHRANAGALEGVLTMDDLIGALGRE